MKVWLADLTYTQQTIASDVVPAAIAMIAEYVVYKMDDPPDFKIFKFPEDLSNALEQECPDVLGFSNYIWNSNLSMSFCRRVKEIYPDVITVVGGPHIPTVVHEQGNYINKHSWVDFFIMKEGEEPFLQLLENLHKYGGSIPDSLKLPNVLYRNGIGNIVHPVEMTRISNLEEVPSPYLSGRLDKFLDGKLLPVIQTNRGCPFECTFCTEGQSYWSKIQRKKTSLLADEIRYISNIITNLISKECRTDLLIADSNFGMFKEDIELCKIIANEQKNRSYPSFINVATGKNRKERVLEAARIVNGAIKLAGSVQSLDQNIQENIKRKNISTKQVIELALESSEVGANTYSEVILGLPGDSLRAHFSTIHTLIKAGFNTISMYQLMLLPGTELGLEYTKKHYGMSSRYRVVPRCFGVYDVLGEKVNVAEVEEICISGNDLPYEDYLSCRKMNFIVSLFYNDGVFSEIITLFVSEKISIWKWLCEIYSNSYSTEFDELTTKFLNETKGELWTSRDDLISYLSKPGAINKYIDGELGNNLIFKYKAISLTTLFPDILKVALASITDTLNKQAPNNIALFEVIEDILDFKRMQIDKLFEEKCSGRYLFKYNIPHLSKLGVNNEIDIPSLKFSSPQTFKFEHSKEQQEIISSSISLFGSSVVGLSRILSRVYLKTLFREPICISTRKSKVK